VRLLILLLTFYSATIFSAGNEAEAFKSLDDYRVEYKEKYDAIFSMIESRKELNFREKQAHYDREVAALKTEFKTQRLQDYAVQSEAGSGSEPITQSVEHSCKGISSSSAHFSMPINCGYKCVNQPTEKMFTKEEWVTVTGGVPSDLIISQTRACIELRSIDTSLTKATLSAVFKYNESNIELKSAEIELKVAEEADALFTQ
jgi:hypothetical protein